MGGRAPDARLPPMSGNLVIVESPAKAKTIERYLGPGYTVLASYGHIRDLPENPGKNQLGVDVDHDFAPEYEVVADRRKQLSAIQKAAAKADLIYLATDLDREGEAIAWHVAEAAQLAPDRTRRVTFSEITEAAIKKAFAEPRSIDRNLVDAQQARRVVDRLVGYTLSPLLWRKVRAGLSAGRGQSVAVRLVVDREREIRAFNAREYWTLKAVLVAPNGDTFEADLVRIEGQKPEVGDGDTAERHAAAIRASHPVVTDVSLKRTMSAAQRLYEGVEMDEGPVGLITYMRTDSVAMSVDAVAEAARVIEARFGAEYTTPKGRAFKTKTRNAQEAHEAIRPTSFVRDPETLSKLLGSDEARLYRLIGQREIASQMATKEQETTSVELAADGYGMRANATRTTFDGFSRVYTEGRDDGEEEAECRLPQLAKGDATAVEKVEPLQHFTEAPPRFTEASLIKALEEHGIGRPSTYAATISTITDRGYVKVVDRRLHPESVGEVVTDLLVGHFGEFVDLEFTARMEDELDEVASGKRAWVPFVREFYTLFHTRIEEKPKELRRADFTTRPSDEVCSQGHPMVIRLGRYGEFVACSMYPEHKETRELPGVGNGAAAAGDGSAGQSGEPPAPETCPKCGEAEGGVLVQRRGRFGPFMGCGRYPECDYIKKEGPPPPPPLPFEAACPTCGKGHLAARRARRTGSVFWGCSKYPNCRFTTSHEPVGAVHDVDGGLIGRVGGAALCLVCGAPVEISGIDDLIGKKLAGGDPDPAALARPSSGKGGAGRRTGRPASGKGTKGGSVAKRGKPASPRRGESADHTPPGWDDPAAQGD